MAGRGAFADIGKGADAEPSAIGMLVAGVFLLGVGIYQLWSLATKGQTLGKKCRG